MSTAPICAWCNFNLATGYEQNFPICLQCYSKLYPQVPVESVLSYQQPLSQFSPDLLTIDNLAIAGLTRFCRRCKLEISNSVASCQNCGYVELELVPTEAATGVTTPGLTAQNPINLGIQNPCWKCRCGYEYNRWEECEKCKRPKEVEETKGGESEVISKEPKRPALREEAKSVVPQIVSTECGLDSGLKLWGCSKGHGFNFATDKCCRVCEERNPRDPIAQSHSYPSIADLTLGSDQVSACEWVCFSCEGKNRGKIECRECKCPRTWLGYLGFKKVRLNAAQTKWQCQNCQAENELVVDTCQKCRKTNAAIRKWTQNGKEPEETSWWNICGC